MRNKNAQMSLFDTYCQVSKSKNEEPPKFFRLLNEHIDWDSIIPERFYTAFYRRIGRNRAYSLESFIKALVLQDIFGYIEDAQLLNTLRHSKEMRDFCGFAHVPDASKITRFKQNFGIYLQELFDRLVEITDPICREMDAELADCLIPDTTGIESYVAENNLKFMSTKLRQSKAFAKTNPGFDPYKGIYQLLPEAATSNPNVRHQYINGHFCYAQKAGIVTNGLGIVRHIALFDEEFKKNHPQMKIEKRSENPDADKEIGDSTALKPLLSDFFKAHPSLKYTTFIGDSSFDSYDNYNLLLNEFHFEKALIPLNMRNSGKDSHDFDENGTPLCPADKTPMTYIGKCAGKSRSLRFKWVCHKSIAVGSKRICTCDHPCTDSSYGKCVYTYPHKNLRLYPGIARDSNEWDSLYKKRVFVERTIYSFKEYGGVSRRKTSNPATTKADLLLAGIVQLIGVVLADALHQHKFARRIRKLIA
jgi:transposase